jgi:hypothetical protein
MHHLVVGEHHAHAVLQQESPKHALVLSHAPAMRETRPEVAEHDEGHQDLLGLFQDLDRFVETFTEIHISICADSDLHRQRSLST